MKYTNQHYREFNQLLTINIILMPNMFQELVNSFLNEGYTRNQAELAAQHECNLQMNEDYSYE